MMDEIEYTNKAIQTIKHCLYSGKQINGRNIYASKDGWIVTTNADGKIVTAFQYDPMAGGDFNHLMYFDKQAEKIDYEGNFLTNILKHIDTKNQEGYSDIKRLDLQLFLASSYIKLVDCLINGDFQGDHKDDYYIYLLFNASEKIDRDINQLRTKLLQQEQVSQVSIDKESVGKKTEADEKLHIFAKKTKRQKKQMIRENENTMRKLILFFQQHSQSLEKFTNEILSDDANYALQVRENIHNYYKSTDEYFGIVIDQKIISILRETDQKLIKYIQNNNNNESIYFNSKYPNSHWWWHLNELGKLNKKDLETI